VTLNAEAGVEVTGGADGNRIVANSIFDNGSIGIDLVGEGTNNDLAAPTLDSATTGSIASPGASTPSPNATTSWSSSRTTRASRPRARPTSGL
jgi:hypothetical protein